MTEIFIVMNYSSWMGLVPLWLGLCTCITFCWTRKLFYTTL